LILIKTEVICNNFKQKSEKKKEKEMRKEERAPGQTLAQAGKRPAA
jgi:hypothetical protein